MRFRVAGEAQPYEYERNSLERLGDALRKPQALFADTAIRQIQRPATIALLTLLAVVVITIGFYPDKIRDLISALIPWAAEIRPWMLKLVLYLGVQVTILGLGLRALGRFRNQHLMHAWQTHRIDPVFVGQKRLPF
jgi:hypothetical protein